MEENFEDYEVWAAKEAKKEAKKVEEAAQRALEAEEEDKKLVKESFLSLEREIERKKEIDRKEEKCVCPENKALGLVRRVDCRRCMSFPFGLLCTCPEEIGGIAPADYCPACKLAMKEKEEEKCTCADDFFGVLPRRFCVVCKKRDEEGKEKKIKVVNLKPKPREVIVLDKISEESNEVPKKKKETNAALKLRLMKEKEEKEKKLERESAERVARSVVRELKVENKLITVEEDDIDKRLIEKKSEVKEKNIEEKCKCCGMRGGCVREFVSDGDTDEELSKIKEDLKEKRKDRKRKKNTLEMVKRFKKIKEAAKVNKKKKKNCNVCLFADDVCLDCATPMKIARLKNKLKKKSKKKIERGDTDDEEEEDIVSRLVKKRKI